MHRFHENVKESCCIPCPMATSTVAVFYTNAELAGTSVDMAKFNNYVAVIQVRAVTQWGAAVTCVIAESTDNTTYSNTYLATVTIASSTTTCGIDTVEVRDEEMSDGYRYLRLECTPAAGTGNIFCAVSLRFNPRYATV